MKIETLKKEIQKLKIAANNLQKEYSDNFIKSAHQNYLLYSARYEGWQSALTVILAWIEEGDTK